MKLQKTSEGLIEKFPNATLSTGVIYFTMFCKVTAMAEYLLHCLDVRKKEEAFYKIYENSSPYTFISHNNIKFGMKTYFDEVISET